VVRVSDNLLLSFKKILPEICEISGSHGGEYEDGFIFIPEICFYSSKLRFIQVGLLLKCFLNIVMSNVSSKPGIYFYKLLNHVLISENKRNALVNCLS
jgi:hypothetical protein